MSNEAQVSVRFTATDTDTVKRALQSLGEEGQRALNKLEAASRGPSAGLNALNAASSEGRNIIDAYAMRLGPFGAALRAIGPIGLGVAASIVGIGVAVKSSFAAIAQESAKLSAMVDAADKINLTTQQLQEYRFAANQSGVSTENFERALETLTRRQGEALEGTGELLKVAQKYRIELDDGTGAARKSSDVLRDIARVMAGLETQSERLTLAQAAFGKGSGDLTNMLRGGPEALDKQADAARRLGVVLDGGLIQGAKKLADELERIKAIGEASYQRALLGDDPESIAKNVRAMEQWERAWNTLIGTIQGAPAKTSAAIGQMGEAFLQAQPWFVKYLTETPAKADAAADALTDFNAAISMVSTSTELSAKEMAESRKEYDQLIRSVDRAADIEARRNERLAQLSEQMFTLVITGAEYERGVRAVNAAADQEIKLNEKRAEKIQTVNEKILEQVASNKDLIAALRVSEFQGRLTAKTQEILAQGFKGSADEARKLAETLIDQESTINQLNYMWSQVGEATYGAAKTNLEEPISRAIENTVDGIKDSFDDLWFDVFRNGRLDFESFLGGLLDSFARTLAEMATLALAQPIIVPMLSNVGASLGLSNGQINQLGQGFGVSDAASLASLGNSGFNFAALNKSVFSGFSTSSLGQRFGLSSAFELPGFGGATPEIGYQLTGLGKTFDVMSSPAGLLGGALGSMLPGLLGFKPRKGPGDEIGTALGTAGGSYLATTALLSAIPGVNFFAPFLGAALGKTLGGLFGAKPSSQQEVGTLWLGSGQRTFNDLGAGKNNEEFETEIRGFLDTIDGLKSAFEQSTGGRVTTGYTTLSIDKRDGTQLIIDGQKSSVASTEDAVRAVLKAFVSGIEGVTPDIKQALDKIDWSGDLQKAAADLDFVVAFKPTIDAMTAGALSIKDSVKELAGAEIREVTAQIIAFKDNTARLGLSTTDADMATRKYVEQMLGLGDVIAPQSALATALEALQGRIEALGPLLNEVGITLTPEQIFNQERNRLGDQLGDRFRRRRNASGGMGYLNDLEDLGVNISSERADAALLGRSTADLEAAFKSEIDTILLNAITGAGTLESATAALNAIKEKFAGYPEIVAAADEQLLTLNDTLGITAEQAELAARAVEEQARLAAALAEESRQRVNALLQEEINLKVEAAEAGVDSAKSLIDLMTTAGRKIDDVLLRFKLDGQFGMLTPAASLAANEEYFFNDLAKRAMLGDTDALDQLGDVGSNLVEMAQQMFGSNSQSVSIQQRVRTVLEQAKALTVRQVDLGQLTLDTQQASLIELRNIASLISGRGGAVGANGFTTADLDGLIGQYNQAAAAGGAGFIGSAGYGAFVSGANRVYAGLSDTGRLQSELAFFQANLNGPHGSAYQGYVDTITARLQQLGVPGYDLGGDHRGGLRIVGESGRELENTGPSRIFNARQTQTILSGAVAEAQGMGPKLDDIAVAARASAVESSDTALQIRMMRGDISRLTNTIQNLLDRSAPKKSGPTRTAA